MNPPLLFLDIDGVMNNTESCLLHRSGLVFTADAVSSLSRMVRESNCGIVITSTRRSAGMTALKGMFVQNGMTHIVDRIIGMTPRFTNSDVDDSREDEIQAWLDAHRVFNRYAILDDKPFTGPLVRRLVRTDSDRGLVPSMIPFVGKLLSNGCDSSQTIRSHLDDSELV